MYIYICIYIYIYTPCAYVKKTVFWAEGFDFLRKRVLAEGLNMFLILGSLGRPDWIFMFKYY